jgi:hypothetical protein
MNEREKGRARAISRLVELRLSWSTDRSAAFWRKERQIISPVTSKAHQLACAVATAIYDNFKNLSLAKKESHKFDLSSQSKSTSTCRREKELKSKSSKLLSFDPPGRVDLNENDDHDDLYQTFVLNVKMVPIESMVSNDPIRIEQQRRQNGEGGQLR